MTWADTYWAHLIDRILFWNLIILLAIDLNFLVFHRGIPNIRTAPAIRKKYIELIRADMVKRKPGQPYTIVDVGSGNGLVTRTLARALPEAHIIGLEIAHQSVWWSNMMKRIFRLKNLEYRRMNFLNFDFAEADAITMYLIANAMIALSEKFEKETRPGTLILSNKFRLLGDWKPVEVLEVKTRYPHQKLLYMYRKG